MSIIRQYSIFLVNFDRGSQSLSPPKRFLVPARFMCCRCCLATKAAEDATWLHLTNRDVSGTSSYQSDPVRIPVCSVCVFLFFPPVCVVVVNHVLMFCFLFFLCQPIVSTPVFCPLPRPSLGDRCWLAIKCHGDVSTTRMSQHRFSKSLNLSVCVHLPCRAALIPRSTTGTLLSKVLRPPQSCPVLSCLSRPCPRGRLEEFPCRPPPKPEERLYFVGLFSTALFVYFFVLSTLLRI